MKTKKYRILSNGYKFEIQEEKKFLGVEYWEPFLRNSPTLEDAERRIAAMNAKYKVVKEIEVQSEE